MLHFNIVNLKKFKTGNGHNPNFVYPKNLFNCLTAIFYLSPDIISRVSLNLNLVWPINVRVTNIENINVDNPKILTSTCLIYHRKY